MQSVRHLSDCGVVLSGLSRTSGCRELHLLSSKRASCRRLQRSGKSHARCLAEIVQTSAGTSRPVQLQKPQASQGPGILRTTLVLTTYDKSNWNDIVLHLHLVDLEGNRTSPLQLQFVETDTGHSPFSTIGRALEDKALDIIAAVKQQQERTWHPRMIADVQLPESFGEPYAAVISLQKQGGVEQTRLSGLQIYDCRLPQAGKQGTGVPKYTYQTAINSYLHYMHGQRPFFMNQALLPSQVPSGSALAKLRQQELDTLQGKGKEPSFEPKLWDRVYQFDVYDDLSMSYTDADRRDPAKARPTLGGSREWPYPRRLRTGGAKRQHADEEGRVISVEAQPDARSPDLSGMYVGAWLPADEHFEPGKQIGFVWQAVLASLPALAATGLDKLKDITVQHAPSMPDTELVQKGYNIDQKDTFHQLAEINSLFGAGVWDYTHDRQQHAQMLKGPAPLVWENRNIAWDQDVELGRQMLSGMHPCVIEAATEVPFGTITEDHVAELLGGRSVKDLLAEGGRLFKVDYSLLQPYIEEINNQKLHGDGTECNTHVYAARCMLFRHSKSNHLVPVAIELSTSEKDTDAKVYTPQMEPEVWRMAKAHFRCVDAGWHQLISHWLQTHGCQEPYVIATNRQLSAQHPLHRLLHPHLRYTMQINAQARGTLVNCSGLIEKNFFGGKYAMGLSSIVYGKLWTFEGQALPANLIARGMVKETSDSPESNEVFPFKGKNYRLLFDDYPFAADGILLWKAIHGWAESYVRIYYQGPGDLAGDAELQAWWADVREGHTDKAEGWPEPKSTEELALILSTIIWMGSCHHAAVNFGQYDYGSFMPNHPTIMHKAMLETDDLKAMLEPDNLKGSEYLYNPDRQLLDSLPNKEETLALMAALELLSTHDPDEQYLHQRPPGWTMGQQVLQEWEAFCVELQRCDQVMATRNQDRDKRARFPDYTILRPSVPSEEIVKGRRGWGVPNSISI